MPFKRTYGTYKSNSARVYRARIKRVKRTNVRRAGAYKKSSIGRSLSVHSFTRMSNNFQIQLAAGTSYNSGAILFKLDDLVNHTEFTALFDQYKITKVDVMFKLHTNSFQQYATQLVSGTIALAPTTFPTLWLVNDKDDSTSLSRSEFQERGKAVRRVLSPNKIIKWTVRPCILTQLYRTVASTGYAPKYGQFIDCAQPNVPHYCTKWGLDYDGYTLPAITAGPYGQNIDVGVEMRYHFTCKDVR